MPHTSFNFLHFFFIFTLYKFTTKKFFFVCECPYMSGNCFLTWMHDAYFIMPLLCLLLLLLLFAWFYYLLFIHRTLFFFVLVMQFVVTKRVHLDSEWHRISNQETKNKEEEEKKNGGKQFSVVIEMSSVLRRYTTYGTCIHSIQISRISQYIKYVSRDNESTKTTHKSRVNKPHPMLQSSI